MKQGLGAVCLAIANVVDAKKQSIGRVIDYIVPSIRRSDKMDTAVCLAIANVVDAKKQSIGRVIDYIVPSIRRSDKMVW
ncbi:hypothetical protein H5410_014483, partial [Solanum commersonii]